MGKGSHLSAHPGREDGELGKVPPRPITSGKAPPRRVTHGRRQGDVCEPAWHPLAEARPPRPGSSASRGVGRAAQCVPRRPARSRGAYPARALAAPRALAPPCAPGPRAPEGHSRARLPSRVLAPRAPSLPRALAPRAPSPPSPSPHPELSRALSRPGERAAPSLGSKWP